MFRTSPSLWSGEGGKTQQRGVIPCSGAMQKRSYVLQTGLIKEKKRGCNMVKGKEKKTSFLSLHQGTKDNLR